MRPVLETGEPRRPRFEGNSVYQDIGMFTLNYLARHPEGLRDERMVSLFSDLQRGFFWGVLTTLDGPANEGLTGLRGQFAREPQQHYSQIRTDARAWTKQNFTEPNLNGLVDLTIDLAINPPAVKGRQGFVIGHSTLLRHMVDKPGSIFSDAVTDSFRQRLVNGAFWEELGTATNRRAFEDILSNHSSDLNPAFATKGLDLYQRNREMTTSSIVKIDMDMTRFPINALDTYMEFMTSLAARRLPDGQREIAAADLDGLLKPYILAVLAEDPSESYSLRFGPKYDTTADTIVTPVNGFPQRLNDPLVQESLARSKANQRAVAERLGNILLTSHYNNDAALDVLAAIGGETGDQILQRIIKSIGSELDSANLQAVIDNSASSLKDRAEELLMVRDMQLAGIGPNDIPTF